MQPSHARPRTGRKRLTAAFAVLAVACVVAVVLVLTNQAPTSTSDGTVPSAGKSGRADTSAAASRPDDACRKQVTAAGVALDRAARAIAQWRLHVTAMNKLVAGEITPEQATAAWKRSDKGNVRRVHQFEAADEKYRDRFGTSGCSAPASSDCKAAMRATTTALGAGEKTVATWKKHIKEMNMLVAGEISSAQATAMWSKMWQRGMYQVVEFQAKRDIARHQDC